ncbi:hypothetical protein PRZ48_010318 [Zasmidium cellare]|uniref:Carrier domain-containing protein n=1 Tax=Zasmidium cellare TaxID=395010 RepID=A0ABR0E8V9_ZASCE|nr:hypothetical protein PRZ48_010318 [Zasmidium cellare]
MKDLTKTPVQPAPPGCGRRLLSHLIDERAADGHPRPFASIPISRNAADGYRDVSYAVFANAINRLARWLLDNLGSPATPFEPIVYIAGADLRYHVLNVAAVKAGYIVFLPSPRNSQEAFDSLMAECGAQKLLIEDKPSPAVAMIEKTRSMQKFTIPSLEMLLDPTPVPQIHLEATWEEYRFKPFLQIHSSGSTGIPKLSLDAYQMLDTNEAFGRLGDQRLLVSFPPFHMAGLIYGLAFPCWCDSTVVLPPAAPLTADVVNEIHLQAKVDYSALAPSVVTDLAKNPQYLENLSKLKGLGFAGGPLSEATGQLIVPHTVLHAGIGASEWMCAPLLPKTPDEWPYFRFNERQGGYEFRERGEGLYEMCIVRQPEWELAQPVFVNFPDLDEFCSKDLFSKHPTKLGLWKYVSRLDDVIVFSNGEKLNPVTFEGLVTTSPDVKGCVVVGQGRFQAALIIEPGDHNEAEILEKIWPIVERANGPTVKHGRIAKDHVFFTSPGKPLPRAGKGTVQRAAANRLYAEEIEELYSSLQDGQQRGDVRQKKQGILLGSYEEAKSSISAYLCKELDIAGLGDDEDFFAYGLDSLQDINLVRAINTSREVPIDTKLVYDNATVNKLTAALLERNLERYDFNNDSDDEELKESWLAMDEMYDEMTAQIGRTEKRKKLSRKTKNRTVKPVVQPDGGTTAWLQVLSMFLVNVNNWGLVNSFGVFQAFYQERYLSDYPASSIAWIGTIQGALLLIVGVISGPLFDRGYFKTTLTLGSVGLVFALMMLSLSKEYYQIMLTQGVLLGVCEGLLYIPSVALVPVWFKKNRGLAVGLSTGGGSIGGVIYPAMFYRLLEEVGFAWAVRIMGFIALATLGCAILLSKPLSPRSPRQLVDMSSFRDVSYLAFIASAFLLLAGMFVPFFLATIYSASVLQTTTPISFYVISILNAAQFLGRVLPAWASDYKHSMFGPEAWQFTGELALGIMGFCWAGVHNLGGYIPWLIIYGFLSGFALTLPAIVLPYICPNLAVYGTRIGMLYAIAGIGFLISTPIATAANTASGGFLGSQMWTGATCVGASLLFLVTAFEARKRRLLYEMGKRERRLLRRKGRKLRLEDVEKA